MNNNETLLSLEIFLKRQATLFLHVFFLGVGIGMIVISFIGNIYYNMIIAWSLYYMFASFQATLPWDGCHHEYNTKCKYAEKG